MRKILRIFISIIAVIITVTLVSCNTKENDFDIKGKEVTLTNNQLSRKLSRLRFEPKEEAVMEMSGDFFVRFEDNENNQEVDFKLKQVLNTKNYDTWTNFNYVYIDKKGLFDATVGAFESRSHTYFEIEYINNKEFKNPSYNIRLDQTQKYMIEKPQEPWFGYDKYSLAHVMSVYNIDLILLNIGNAVEALDYDLLQTLNMYDFNGLKFYEEDSFFTIELKLNLDDMLNTRPEIKNAIIESFYLEAEIDNLYKYDVEMIFTYENNKIIQFTLKTNEVFMKNQFGEEDYFWQVSDKELKFRFVDKLPKEIKYNDYEQITKPEDIILAE